MERALIIRKEWLDKIFNTGKCWEMRSAKTNVRGEIGLIEAGSGLIVGKAKLTGCADKPLTLSEAKQTFSSHQVEDVALLKKWCFAWFLEEVEIFDEPIPYKHPGGAVTWVKINT